MLFLAFFTSSQGQERGFLRFRHSLDTGDIHALVWSLANKCSLACNHLDVPELDDSIVTATGERTSVRDEIHPPDPAGMAM